MLDLRRLAFVLIGLMSLAAVPPPRPKTADPQAALSATLKTRYPSVMTVLVDHGGCRAFNYYRAGTDAGTRLPLHSMTKSVLGMLLGMAIHQGDFGIDQTLGDLLPEASDPKIDPRVRRITLRQLMTMTAGFDAEAKPPEGMPLSQLWRWSLTRQILSAPGREFRYDNDNANLLSVILTGKVGQAAELYARTRLFEHLDIRNYTWLDDGDGHSVGAYGLWMTAPDMAKIGRLALHHGVWNGRQLVPEDDMLTSISKHNEGGPPFYAAYGELWWVKPTKAGQAAFFALGSDGQAIYVVPKRDLVIVVASDKTPPGGVLGLIGDVVLPASAAVAARPCGRSDKPSP